MKEQELREKLTKELKCHTLIPGSAFGVFIEDIIALFKKANYVRLADDQSLPEYPELTYDSYQSAFEGSQQEMRKKGWRKVEL